MAEPTSNDNPQHEPEAHPELTQTNTETEEQRPEENLPEDVRTLKEAFPDLDVDVIKDVLASKSGNIEAAFEVLLNMSDPDYNPEPPRTQGDDDESAPPMPPRPEESPITNAQFLSDEELARQLAREEEELAREQYRRRQQQQQQSQNDGDNSGFNFSEELPIIKAQAMEAGVALKKKAMQYFSQVKEKINNATNNGSSSATSPTHAQYRGLPNDETDDLLTPDMSALRLSDKDVYRNTTAAAQMDHSPRQGQWGYTSPTLQRTSTSEQQMRDDEELARRIAREEYGNPQGDNFVGTEMHAPETPPRVSTDDRTVDAPTPLSKPDEPQPDNKADSESRPYVIGDVDSEDELVDVEDDHGHTDAGHKTGKVENTNDTSAQK